MALCRGLRLLLFRGWPIIDKPAELGRIGELLPGIPTIPVWGYMLAALCCTKPIRILAIAAWLIPGRNPAAARLDAIPRFIGLELFPKPDIDPIGEDIGRTLPIPITFPRPLRPTTLLIILPMFMAEPSPIITFLDIGCCCCSI
uniref:Uncharacterized protein n=1 Tax=Arundo donax TaxID=35708 RepID=A0A0A9CQE6_ARUDO